MRKFNFLNALLTKVLSRICCLLWLLREHTKRPIRQGAITSKIIKVAYFLHQEFSTSFNRWAFSEKIHSLILKWNKSVFNYDSQYSIYHIFLYSFTFSHFLTHYFIQPTLSPPGSIFQILTCLIWALWVHVTYLFIDSVIKSCDSPDRLVHTCYQSASSCVTETKLLSQKCFCVENIIIVSLNTVISIIVIV